MYLESPQNPRIRCYSQLKTKKGRTEQGLFIAEGLRLLEELVSSDIQIEAVLWNVATAELFEDLLLHDKLRGKLFELSPQAFSSVADTVTPQGVIAIAKIPDKLSPSHCTQAVLLDGLQDPGNVGTILRTCDAFGIRGVCCGTGTVDPYAPKVVRAAMGGLFRQSVQSADSEQFLAEWRLRHPHGKIVAASANAQTFCYDTDLTGAVLFIVGSEAHGVRSHLLQAATLTVSIPMQSETESLNASVAASILFYEAFRQQAKT